MPSLIPDFTKHIDDETDRVTLTNPRSGLEVKMNAWEARLLPFLDTGPDAKTIALNAAETGVSMPVDHVEALLKRLRAAGLLIAPSTATELVEVPPELMAPAPAPAPAPSSPSVVAEDSAERRSLALGAFQEEAADIDRAETVATHTPTHPPLEPTPAPQSAQPRVFVPPVDVAARTAKLVAHKPKPFTRLHDAVDEDSPPPAPIGVARTQKHVAYRPKAVTQQHPAVDEEEEVPPRPRKRRSARPLVVLIATAASITAAAFIPWPYGIVAPCVLQPIVRQPVRLPVAVVIRSISVEEGQAVKAGDVLAAIDPERLKLEQQKTQEAISVINGELKTLKSTGRPDLSTMRQLVAARSTQMRVAYLEFRRVEALTQSGQATAADTDKATAAIAVAKDALVQVQAELADAVAHPPEDLHLKEAELERLRITLARQSELTAQPEIRSPIDGTIAALLMRAGNEGETLEAGGELMEIVQLERLRAEARIPQQHLEKAQVGAPVRVGVTGVVQGYSSRLDRVGSAMEEEAGERFVRVVALIDNSQGVLRQHAQCTLEVEAERDSVLQTVAQRAGKWLNR